MNTGAPVRPTRRAHRSLVGLGLAAVITTALATGAARTAAASIGQYSAAVSPAKTVPLTAQTYAVTIVNQSAPESAIFLGAANVAVPAAFAVSSLGTPTTIGSHTWTATMVGQLLELRAATPGDALLPGQSVTVSAIATAARNSFGFYSWNTAAAATSTFNDPASLFSYQGAQPAVEVGQQASVVPCPANQSCDSGLLTAARSSVDVLANSASTNDVLTTAIGGLPPMSCTLSGDVARFTVQDRTKTITYVLFGEYDEGHQICFGSSQEFTQQGGHPAPFVNGEYEGILPTCAQDHGVAPCVQSQSDNEKTDTLSSTILAPVGDPATSGH